jgi:putative hemolysin
LYTSKLFAYDPRFGEGVGKAFELGRSFVQPAYQKQYRSLLLLWKGIGRLIAAHPDVHRLFGAVSVSSDYSAASRQLIADVLLQRYPSAALAASATPRQPLRAQPLAYVDAADLARWTPDIDELSSWVSDLDPGQGGVPVLVRQYVKMGAEFIAFNVDSTFNNSLDGLILVDLDRTEPRQRARFLGAA